jgi:F420-non-reducing hydrogenase iron-sulfur subunit
MTEPVTPNVIVNVCQNCIPAANELPRQWRQDGIHVVVREVPCSGKIDGQYLLHALEGVTHGLCVVACPKGQCHFAEGNYRAEIRIRTIRRLLAEIGLEPERADLLHFSPDYSFSQLEQLVRGAVERLSALGRSPLHPVSPETGVQNEPVAPSGEGGSGDR